MFYFLPKLYKEDTGEIPDSLFVRVGKTTRELGSGEMWNWIRVKKIGPGIYRSIGRPFYDISLCYRVCDGNL